MNALLPIPTPTACRRWIFTATWVLSASLAEPAWAALTVNSDATVLDTTTSLVWDQCPYGLTGASCATGAAFYDTWAPALNAAVAANAASYKGFNDWRVPNKNELDSIVKLDTYTVGQPAIDTAAFPNTPITGDSWGFGFTWTSTTYTPDPTHAWAVAFAQGDTGSNNKTSATAFVRLVRSGQPLASFDSLSPPSNGTASIPTLSEWGAMLLSGLILVLGWGQVRRRGGRPSV